MNKYLDDSVRVKISKLQPWAILAFMASCCERMIPNYREFNRQTRFGDVDVLRNALDAVWRSVAGDADVAGLQGLALSCEAQAPEPSNYDSTYSSAALDAATAISMAAAAATASPDSHVALGVAELGRDTVDIYIQLSEEVDPNAEGFEFSILSNPLMQAELGRQYRALDCLSEVDNDGVMRSEIVRNWAGVEVASLPVRL